MSLFKNFKEVPYKNLETLGQIGDGYDDDNHDDCDDGDADGDADGDFHDDDDDGDDGDDVHLVSRTLSCSAFANQNWLFVSRAS